MESRASPPDMTGGTPISPSLLTQTLSVPTDIACIGSEVTSSLSPRSSRTHGAIFRWANLDPAQFRQKVC